MRLLLIEDDSQIGSSLQKSLEAECFVVDWAQDGQKGSDLARINEYDLVILDYMLPAKNGDQICKEIRENKKHVPIIVLSVMDKIEAKVSLLGFGADDYLTKPFSFEELKARIQALLRRPRKIQEDILVSGDLLMNISENRVARKGEEIYLTRKEFVLLEYFMKNKGKVLSRSMISEHVWDMDFDPFSNTIEAHILKLRKKLHSQDGREVIKTIQGRGYKLE